MYSFVLLLLFQITETYAFLPREAVTRFLLGCTDCQRHPRSPSPLSVLPTPSPSPTLPLGPTSTAPLVVQPQPALSVMPPQAQLTPPTQPDAHTELAFIDYGNAAESPEIKGKLIK